jgi:Tol biopolymer transport system component
MTLPTTPYKGLMPYSEEDAPFFFGREAEREIITANLLASRLTLLYGASGVGKTSVLRAGVAYHLRQLARQNLAERGTPEFAVVVFSSWRDDPIAGLVKRVQDSVAQALDLTPQNSSPLRIGEGLGERFAQTLPAWTERVGGDLLIILDQFEEYFLYHPQEDGEGTFAVEFPRAVNRPDLRASFLVSIREDSLANLDRFKGRIPNLFDNYLRIEHLDREAARAAIEKPIEEYNRLVRSARLSAPSGAEAPTTNHLARSAHFSALSGAEAPTTNELRAISIEPALVEAILNDPNLLAGKLVLGEAGRGVVRGGLAPTQIETPYLQLVMTRLWDEEVRAGSRVLRLETLNRLGGAERIVRTHLDAAMSALPPSEQDTAARVFYHLVTPSGTKIAHTVPDLAEYARLPQAELTPVLDKLSSAAIRVLRPVAPPPDQPGALRYEIFHDVLAPAILDWRERHLRRARARRWQAAGAMLVVLIVFAFAGMIANVQQKAQEVQSSRDQLAQQAQQARDASELALKVLPTSGATAEPSVVAARLTAEAIATSAAQVLQTLPTPLTLTPTEIAVRPMSPTATLVPTPVLLPTSTPTTAAVSQVSAGTQIVFHVTGEGGGQYLYVIGADGTNRRPLKIDIQDSLAEFQPHYSIRQKLLALTIKRRLPTGGSEHNIYIAGLDGSGVRALTSQQFDNWDPAWSPDGSRLAFVTSRHDPGEIYIMSADGGRETQKRITYDAARDEKPSWAPDNRHIVFSSPRGAKNPLESHLYSVDSERPELVSSLTEGFVSDLQPWWSTARPDDTRIVFVRREDTNRNGRLDDDPTNVWIIDSKTRKARNLTGSASNEYDPSISPDGQWIAFSREAVRTGKDIFLMTINGEFVTQLTHDPADEARPVWVPPW